MCSSVANGGGLLLSTTKLPPLISNPKGYALGLLLEACIQYQSATPHLDPIHITAHFLRPTVAAPFTVHVRTIKTGSGFTNLTAELLQEVRCISNYFLVHQLMRCITKNTVKIMAHTIFGVNALHPEDKARLTLEPPSPWARRHPLYTHPSQCELKPMRDAWKFRQHVQWTEDQQVRARNQPGHPNRTTSTTVGGGSLEWGGWYELTGKEDRITKSTLTFFADMFMNTPQLLPKSERMNLQQA